MKRFSLTPIQLLTLYRGNRTYTALARSPFKSVFELKNKLRYPINLYPSLAAELKDIKKKHFSKLDQFEQDKLERFTKEVVEIQAQESIQVGEIGIPTIRLTTDRFDYQEIDDILNFLKKPIIFTFFTGDWDPYAKAQMRRIQEVYQTLRNMRVQFYGVTPQFMHWTQKQKREDDIQYDILWDRGNQLAKFFGIAYKVPKDILQLWNPEADLKKYNREEGSEELPISASILISPERKIEGKILCTDFTKLHEPEELINMVKEYRQRIKVLHKM
jgi:peroxiredoxin